MAKKVLVVEDDPDVRLFTETVLEEHGYEHLAASDGVEGIQVIRSRNPDLVILDVLMPRRSGIKLYRELRMDETLKTIPVIVLSGISKKSFLRSQEALTEFGDEPVPEPDAYLEKPVEPEELAGAVDKIIG